MNRRNLVPQGRRRRRAVRRAGVRWGWAVPAVTVALLLGEWGLSAALPSAAADVAEASRTAAQAATARAAAARIRLQVRAAGQSLDAAREVSDQPDWSLLLADLSHRLGNDLVLSSCELSSPTPAGTLTLKLSGVARSPPAVTAFALRLEGAGLFDRVDLIQTSPAQLMGTDAVGFQMTCDIAVPAGGRVP